MRPLATLCLLAVLASACSSFRRAPLQETPEAPFFDDLSATRDGRAARASGDVSRVLGPQLRAYGLQPLTREDRRLALGADTVAAGFVAGKDGLRQHRLVVVAVSGQAGASALGGFAELARVTARLARQTRFPESTVLFTTLPPNDPQEALRRLVRGPAWVADSVQAVVVIGGPPAAGRHVVPEEATAGATARAAYAVLKPLVYGLRFGVDSTHARSQL